VSKRITVVQGASGITNTEVAVEAEPEDDDELDELPPDDMQINPPGVEPGVDP
jgi:hypothetical protein